MRKSIQKNSPDTCPLAEAGREAVGIYDVYDLEIRRVSDSRRIRKEI